MDKEAEKAARQKPGVMLAAWAGIAPKAGMPGAVVAAWPSLFLAAHLSAIRIWPAQSPAWSLAFLIFAPLLAALACCHRARRAGQWEGWLPLALGMFCWAAGMAATMATTLLLDGGTEGSIGMLLFTLYAVPLLFAVASPEGDIWPVRLVDGALALALGYLFFAFIFSIASLSGADAGGVAKLRMMFDIQNIFIALFAFVRFRASGEGARRGFFAALFLFGFAYLLAAAYINHVESDTDYGTPTDLIIDFPFLMLAMIALWRPTVRPVAISPVFARVVRAGSPLMLPGGLLVVSALLMGHRPMLAVCGFVAATLGYGLRSVLAQVRGLRERERLEQLSSVDALTGLANRRQFDVALHCARTDVALLMIDIDHFKQLNDRFGHQAGDDRLKAVARALASCAQRGTDIVARYGGEEFAVILPGLDERAASAMAEAMRIAVRAAALPSPTAAGIVTVSIGVAHGVGDDPEALLARADAALYAAKAAGRDQVVTQASADG